MENGPSVTLYQLRVLAAIVEHGSFTAAAEALHLSQPAVSAQIRHLRRFAGAPIIVRDGRRVVLTTVGRALYRYAGEMLGATEALRRDLLDIASGLGEHIVVASNLAYSAALLPGMLSRFQESFSTSRISVVDGPSPEVVQRVRAGWADLGIVSAENVKEELLADIVLGELGEDRSVIVESGARPFSRGASLSLDEVTRLPFVRIARAGTSIEAPLNQLLAAAGLREARTVMQFSSFEGTREAVRMGVGVAVMQYSAVRQDIERGELAALDVANYDPARTRVDLVCSPHRQRGGMSEVFHQLIEFVQAEFPLMLPRTAPHC